MEFARYRVIGSVDQPRPLKNPRKTLRIYQFFVRARDLLKLRRRGMFRNMKSIYSSKKVTGFFLGLLLVVGVAVSTSTAQAQYPGYPGGYGRDRDRDYRRDDRYGRYGNY